MKRSLITMISEYSNNKIVIETKNNKNENDNGKNNTDNDNNNKNENNRKKLLISKVLKVIK